jgi:transposase
VVVSRSLACSARALARARPLAGRGWPPVTSRATSASRRAARAAPPPQPLKRGLGVQVLPAHQHPLGLLNQPAVLQGGLQLLGQSPLARSSPPPCCAPGRTLAAAALMPPSPCSAGAAPIPASSGQTIRVRLNRSGDRQLNQALDTVVLTRLRTDPATRAYATRRRAQDKTNRQIKRCLVRYIARQLYRLLETQPALDPT